MSSITEILQRVSSGEERAADALTPLLYDELRSYVRGVLARNSRVAVDATDLVHEAYLRLVDQDRATYKDRAHFFAVAATVIRRVLIDLLRRKRSTEKVPQDSQIALESRMLDKAAPPLDLLVVHEALKDFEKQDAEAAKIVELRFFGGLTLAEVAEVVGMTESAATRRWRYARAHLYRVLGRP